MSAFDLNTTLNTLRELVKELAIQKGNLSFEEIEIPFDRQDLKTIKEFISTRRKNRTYAEIPNYAQCFDFFMCIVMGGVSRTYAALAVNSGMTGPIIRNAGTYYDGSVSIRNEVFSFFKGGDISLSSLNEIIKNEDAVKLPSVKRTYLSKILDILLQTTATSLYASASDEKAFDVKKYITSNKAVIFTGAPGTGKTYSVRKAVKELCNDDNGRYGFVQFHSSYDYSDFVEGLRPVPGENGGNMFVRMDGVFKSFCRKVVEQTERKRSETDDRESFVPDEYYFIIDEINRADLSKVFGELMFGLEVDYRGKNNRFDTQYKNLPSYKMENGKAVEISGDCFRDGFFIPENITVIGTMNDIDRSVESFDFALRRRFQWIDVKANDVMYDVLREMLKIDKKDVSRLAAAAIEMNTVISDESFNFGLSVAYHIGPAYYKSYTGNNIDAIWENKIEPILREYTRGRSNDSVEQFISKCLDSLYDRLNSDNAQTIALEPENE